MASKEDSGSHEVFWTLTGRILGASMEHFLAARDYNPSSKERTLLGTKGKKDINTIKQRDVFPSKLLFTSERAQF